MFIDRIQWLWSIAPVRGVILAAVLMVLGGSAPAQTPAQPPAPPERPLPVVRVALQWQPQSQFAGFYLARDKGLYRAAGLDVTLLHAGVEHSSLDLLQSGAADLATLFFSDAIIAAGAAADRPGSPGIGSSGIVSSGIVQVMQLVQRSNLMLLGWKDLGVTDPGGLDGKRVSYWQGGFSSAFQAFFSLHGVTPRPEPQYASVSLFLKRGVAACAAMEYNEFHRIWQAGVDSDRITALRMRDYGLGFPEDGLYTTSRWASQHRELLPALRAATLAGWAYARAHPEEALDAVLAEAHRVGVAANRPHERWMLEHMLDSIFVPETPPTAAGRLDQGAFARTVSALRSAGLLDRAPEFASFAPFQADGTP